MPTALGPSTKELPSGAAVAAAAAAVVVVTDIVDGDVGGVFRNEGAPLPPTIKDPPLLLLLFSGGPTKVFEVDDKMEGPR